MYVKYASSKAGSLGNLSSGNPSKKFTQGLINEVIVVIMQCHLPWKLINQETIASKMFIDSRAVWAVWRHPAETNRSQEFQLYPLLRRLTLFTPLWVSPTTYNTKIKNREAAPYGRPTGLDRKALQQRGGACFGEFQFICYNIFGEETVV